MAKKVAKKSIAKKATKKTTKTASTLAKAKAEAKKAGIKGISKEALLADYGRKAKAPGKRISKNGNVYYESRINRSDEKGSKL